MEKESSIDALQTYPPEVGGSAVARLGSEGFNALRPEIIIFGLVGALQVKVATLIVGLNGDS